MAVARELGIADESGLVVSGAELDKLSANELQSLAPRIAVYARVTARTHVAHRAGALDETFDLSAFDPGSSH